MATVNENQTSERHWQAVEKGDQSLKMISSLEKKCVMRAKEIKENQTSGSVPQEDLKEFINELKIL